MSGGHSFASAVRRARSDGALIVQPRMGFSDPGDMRGGLLAVRDARARTVGTITLDSYTRVRDYLSAARALAGGERLNGYPILNHRLATTAAMLDDVRTADFPVQVRHGCAQPYDIVRALVALRLDATEGGPISYCLPYGRLPVRDAIRDWARSCRLFARMIDLGLQPHLESFGGCMLGQLCPPSLLIAITVLEALFFRAYGLRSVSLSYAQQTHPEQDAEALRALRALAAELLADLDWHVVVYAYMGVYPVTQHGALRLLRDSARLAVAGGAARLIVKTTAEASRLPTVADNVRALEVAGAAAGVAADVARAAMPTADPVVQGSAVVTAGEDTGILAEARALIDAVRQLHPDIAVALLAGVERGYLDVPFCLHPDNPGLTRSCLDGDGRLVWSQTGSLPIRAARGTATDRRIGSAELMATLSYVKNRYDSACDAGDCDYCDNDECGEDESGDGRWRAGADQRALTKGRRNG